MYQVEVETAQKGHRTYPNGFEAQLLSGPYNLQAGLRGEQEGLEVKVPVAGIVQGESQLSRYSKPRDCMVRSVDGLRFQRALRRRRG